jgi:DNA polymerase I
MNQKVYLIDGSGYIFRAYYGILQPLTTKSGLPTNALFGFTKMILKFLKELQEENGEPPLHIAVIFDAARKNFRHDMYPEYKANRAECPEDLVPQMPYFRKLASALGFPVYEKEGFEADDLIASFVRSAKEEGREVVIVSADKDLTQLVTKDVVMWDPMRDVVFDEAKVEAQFGVPPSLIGDYLSLVGDSSDNIPGAKGVGPKTAVQLLSNFKSLEALLSRLEEVSEIKGLRGAKGVQGQT